MLKNNRTGIIYKATCTETGDAYIGQTATSLPLRKQEHFRKAVNGSDTSFHQAIRDFGEDAFVWDVLADEIPQAELGEHERFYIRFYDTFRGGYNGNQGGGGNTAAPQPHVTFVSETELTLHWELNRQRNEEHVYALAQHMQTFGGFDPAYPIETMEIEGKRHVYSGHHRAAAAFSRDMRFPLLPLAKVPVTVIQGDMDTLIERMWTAHDAHNPKMNAALGLQLTKAQEREQRLIQLSFPHIYRQSSTQLGELWNVSRKTVERLRLQLIDIIDSLNQRNLDAAELLANFHFTPERLGEMERLIASGERVGKEGKVYKTQASRQKKIANRVVLKDQVMQAETLLRLALPNADNVSEKKIRWLNECLTLALPKSTDRLAAMQMLLKRLAEDL